MREEHSFAQEQPDGQPVLSGPQGIGEKPDNLRSSSAMQRFGNYDLVQRIGTGGMGEVYLARQRTAFGREVAVKIIRSDLMHDITVRKRFLREAEVNAYLKHDHILPLVEFGEEKGRLFLVTPYIKGGTLSKRLRGGALTLTETQQLFTALVEAVAYLHKRGVIHRDLKPSNIMLDHEEDSERIYVRLIDFGIASLQGQTANAPLTTAGHEMGTEAYMAPERLSGIAAPSNDIYSLGIILYQMLTGKLPEGVGSGASSVSAAAIDTLLPEPLTEVVLKSTEPDPGKRYISAEDLLKAFENAYKSLSLSHFRVSASNPQLPSVRRNSSPRMPSVMPPPQASYSTPVRPISNEHAARPPVSPLVNGEARMLPNTASTPDTPSIANGLNPTTAQNSSQGTPMVGMSGNVPQMRYDGQNAARPASQPVRLHAEVILPPLSDKSGPFKGEDYEAPTSYFTPQALQKSSTITSDPAPGTAPVPGSRPGEKVVPLLKRTKRGVPVITIVSVVTIIVIFVIGSMSYSIYQAMDTGTVTITPRLESVGTVVNLTAKLNQMSIDSKAGTIPAGVVSSMQSTTSAATRTTGRDCRLIFLNCKAAVADTDVNNLKAQLQSTNRTKIENDISQQEKALGATPVGDIVYGSPMTTANPPVNTVSDTVTVTVALQGSQEYIKTSDARTVATQKLKDQLKKNYTLIDTTVKIGQPVVQSVDGQGNVQIKIPVGGIIRYTITQSDKTALQDQIKGKSVQEARAIIAQNANLDQQNIRVSASYGGNLPGNAGQIEIKEANPSTMPAVQLPVVQ